MRELEHLESLVRQLPRFQNAQATQQLIEGAKVAYATGRYEQTLRLCENAESVLKANVYGFLRASHRFLTFRFKQIEQGSSEEIKVAILRRQLNICTHMMGKPSRKPFPSLEMRVATYLKLYQDLEQLLPSSGREPERKL